MNVVKSILDCFIGVVKSLTTRTYFPSKRNVTYHASRWFPATTKFVNAVLYCILSSAAAATITVALINIYSLVF